MTDSTDLAVRHPWDRRSGESKQAFHSFGVYRDLGPTRSLAKAAKALGKAEGTLEQQSTKYGWVERAEAWDFHVDRERQEARVEEERRSVTQQIQLGRLLRGTAAVRITGREAGARADGSLVEEVAALDPNDMNAQDVARLASEGVRIERTAMGLPTDLSKSLDMLSLREVIELLNQVVEGALDRMPVEEHEGFILFVRSIGVVGRNGQPR
jgi:hypothetical protein